jgi:hypothetical protein
VIFSGGMSYDKAGRTPSITVMHGKNTTVLEMEHNVTDFVTLTETPWSNGRLNSLLSVFVKYIYYSSLCTTLPFMAAMTHVFTMHAIHHTE